MAFEGIDFKEFEGIFKKWRRNFKEFEGLLREFKNNLKEF
jgi:uncharacterized protein YukE